MLPVDVAKTRIQTATPGSARDVGILRNLAMMYREGTQRSSEHDARHCIGLQPLLHWKVTCLACFGKVAKSHTFIATGVGIEILPIKGKRVHQSRQILAVIEMSFGNCAVPGHC